MAVSYIPLLSGADRVGRCRSLDALNLAQISRSSRIRALKVVFAFRANRQGGRIRRVSSRIRQLDLFLFVEISVAMARLMGGLVAHVFDVLHDLFAVEQSGSLLESLAFGLDEEEEDVNEFE